MKNLEGVYFAEPEFFDILQINCSCVKPSEALKEPIQ